MGGHEESALRYRQRAKELAVMLPDVADKLTRETLEKLILDYENLARIQDNLAKS